MQPRHQVVGIGMVVSGARWAFPWICVLALSGGLASAMSLAVPGMTAQREDQATITTALNGGGASSKTDYAQPDFSASSDSCDSSGRRLLYIGLNIWIRAEPPVSPCPDNGA
jgi:hypothetical protein